MIFCDTLFNLLDWSSLRAFLATGIPEEEGDEEEKVEELVEQIRQESTDYDGYRFFDAVEDNDENDEVSWRRRSMLLTWKSSWARSKSI